MGGAGSITVVGSAPVTAAHYPTVGHDQHGVVTHVGSRETEEAVRIGLRCCQDATGGGVSGVELHGDIGQPPFAAIGGGGSAAVDVVPDTALDAAGQIIPEVGIQERVAANGGVVVDGDGGGAVVVAITVVSVGKAGIGKRGGGDGDVVVARGGQPFEQIEAIGIGEGGDGHAVAVAQIDAGGRRQRDGHSGDAHFVPAVLDAVAIDVAPDEIPNAARR